MSSRPELRIDWCDIKAARYAVMHWHYSRSLPSGKLVKIGAWEDGKFIGCVLFGRGANNHLASPFGLLQTGACELVRIALCTHQTPVTRIMAIAVRFLTRNSPGLRLVVSYADPLQGHHGGVYQGAGWVYVGPSQAQCGVMFDGKVMHKRTANSLFRTIKGMQKSDKMWKHKYLLPLDNAMRVQIAALAKPYPKRVKQQDVENPSTLGGVTPTHALQHREDHVPQPA